MAYRAAPALNPDNSRQPQTASNARDTGILWISGAAFGVSLMIEYTFVL